MPLDFCLAHKNELQVHRLLVEHISVTHIPVIVFKFYPFLDVYGHPVVRSVCTHTNLIDGVLSECQCDNHIVVTVTSSLTT